MKQQLTQEQTEIIREIERLRELKENNKKALALIEDNLYGLDIKIRDLRQRLGNITVEEKEEKQEKPQETPEQKLSRLKEKRARIQQEIAELDALLGNDKP